MVKDPPKVLILRLRDVLAMDATGLRAFEDLVVKSKKSGTHIVLSGVHAQPLIVLERSGLLEKVGEENAFGNIDDALNRAREIIGLPHVPRPGPFVATVARERSGPPPEKHPE